MRWRSGLMHPFGLALLAASFNLTLAMLVLPVLEPWSARAPWVAILGPVAYAAAVLVAGRPQPDLSAPELRTIWAVRQDMAARLAQRRAAAGGKDRSEVARILAEAIAQLDKQVIPALRELLDRQRVLSNYLALIEGSHLPSPGKDVLERLRAIHARQRAAIEECVQQAANAAGTLMALMQEGDEANVAARARAWAQDLLTLYDAIAEVLRGQTEVDEVSALLGSQERSSAATTPDPAPSSGGLGADRHADAHLARFVEDALRHLNKLAALSRCELVQRIPRTLDAQRAPAQDARPSGSTPLEQARALREVLVCAIERLKPANAQTSPGATVALQYHILHEEYEEARSIASIMTRHSISERTLHRYRRDAIHVLAAELRRQEELLSRVQATVT